MWIRTYLFIFYISLTNQFQLTEVEHGGATVFPFIDAAIPAKRGSALFWYNLIDGEGDWRTWHAECPVVFGNKWGKFFFRICTLHNVTSFIILINHTENIHYTVAKKWIHSLHQTTNRSPLRSSTKSDSFFVPEIGHVENWVLMYLHLI